MLHPFDELAHKMDEMIHHYRLEMKISSIKVNVLAKTGEKLISLFNEFLIFKYH
jgi:hypothetical protein